MLLVTELRGELAKTRGLLGRAGNGLVYFRTRWGIHTLGLGLSIDVLILDGDGIVVETKENLKPGRLFFWNPRYSRIVELPAGGIKKNHLQKGDKVELKIAKINWK